MLAALWYVAVSFLGSEGEGGQGEGDGGDGGDSGRGEHEIACCGLSGEKLHHNVWNLC